MEEKILSKEYIENQIEFWKNKPFHNVVFKIIESHEALRTALNYNLQKELDKYLDKHNDKQFKI